MLQNLIPSFAWVAPGWRTRRGRNPRDQLMPSGNLGFYTVSRDSSCSVAVRCPKCILINCPPLFLLRDHIIFLAKSCWALSFHSPFTSLRFRLPSHIRSTSPPCLAISALTLLANATASSLSLRRIGGRYQTSQTMAQEDIMRKR